jgi:nucleoside-diphosphate-sugar epimerase
MGARLIFGCGYLGSRVAKRWLAEGHAVHAVTRSARRAAEFEAAGLHPIVADIMQPATLKSLPAVETVLYAVGHDRSGSAAMRDVYVGGLANALASLPGGTGRVIYISSTGVYGFHGGEWVNEDTPCRPDRESGRACLAAEAMLRQHGFGQKSVILRLAGIYGPDRIPRASQLLAGEPIAAPSEGFLNLIHVDDAAAAVLLCERRAMPPALYVVADGRPPQRRDYYAELARLLGAPPPRFASPPHDSPAAERAVSDKRIDSSRIQAELGFSPQFPTYREGLAAIVAGLST